jgi:hypothetical protein
MRTRTLATLAVAAGLVLAVAVPATAKGPVGVTVTGPNGATPVVIDNDTQDTWPSGFGTLMTDMGMWGALGSQEEDAPAPFTPAPPDGLSSAALGPRFQLDWAMYHGGSGTGDLIVTQFLYPEAPGGPVVFTPAGQPVDPYVPLTLGGWTRTTGDVVATLEALGVDLSVKGPASAAEPASRPAPAPAPSPDDGTALAPVVAGVGLAVAAAAAVGTVLVRRRRRDALPAAG